MLTADRPQLRPHVAPVRDPREPQFVYLVDHLGLAQSTVSKHLACLRDCGLVSSTPQGRASMFALAPGVPVDELMAAAELVLMATGAAAGSCATVAPRDSATAGVN